MEKQQKIIIVNGDLDDQRFASLARIDGVFVVTGKVYFKNKTIIPCSLVALGDVEVENGLVIQGNFICEGNFKGDHLIVKGEMTSRKNLIVKRLFVFNQFASIHN